MDMVRQPNLTTAATSSIEVVDDAVYLANARTDAASTTEGPLVMDPSAPVAAGSDSLSVIEVNIGLYGTLMLFSSFVFQNVEVSTRTGMVSEDQLCVSSSSNPSFGPPSLSDPVVSLKSLVMEYLPQMQKRGRWTSPSRAIQVGDLAILKENNVPVLQWKLVRISAVHPGADGVIRVVTVKQSSGAEMKRPVVKVALLPSTFDTEDSEDPISSQHC